MGKSSLLIFLCPRPEIISKKLICILIVNIGHIFVYICDSYSLLNVRIRINFIRYRKTKADPFCKSRNLPAGVGGGGGARPGLGQPAQFQPVAL